MQIQSQATCAPSSPSTGMPKEKVRIAAFTVDFTRHAFEGHLCRGNHPSGPSTAASSMAQRGRKA